MRNLGVLAVAFYGFVNSAAWLFVFISENQYGAVLLEPNGIIRYIEIGASGIGVAICLYMIMVKLRELSANP